MLSYLSARVRGVGCLHELAGVGVESAAELSEGSVDAASERLHASRRRKSDESNNESVLDQILTFFAHQALYFDRQLQKCSACGGDTKKKGFCDNEIAQGSAFEYYRCKQFHKTGCGLICECISETGNPG